MSVHQVQPSSSIAPSRYSNSRVVYNRYSVDCFFLTSSFSKQQFNSPNSHKGYTRLILERRL